jgi:hypothetical protein
MKFRRSLYAALFVFLCVASLPYLQSVRKHLGVDYYQYWIVNKFLEKDGYPKVNFYKMENVILDYGLNESYKEYLLRKGLDKDTQRQITQVNVEGLDREDDKFLIVANTVKPKFIINQTPFLYAFLRPVCLHNYSRSFAAFSVFSFFAFVGGYLILLRVFEIQWSLCLSTLLLVLFVYKPLKSSHLVGNINEIAFFFLALYLFFVSRGSKTANSILGGCFLGLSIILKPLLTPCCLGLVALLFRDPKRGVQAFFGLVMSCYGLVLLSSFLYAPYSWLYWLARMSAFYSDEAYFSNEVVFGNYSLSVILNPMGRRLLTIGIIPFSILTPLLWNSESRTRLVKDFHAVHCLAILLIFLYSRMAWIHYYLYLLFPLAYCLQLYTHGWRRIPCFLVLLALVFLFISMKPVKFLLETVGFEIGLVMYYATLSPLLLLAIMIYYLISGYEGVNGGKLEDGEDV